MRLVFVNHTHPDTLHVSGMRHAYFAKEVARRGHQVVLLTCSLPGVMERKLVEPTLSEVLSGHDWSHPLVVSVPARKRLALELVRRNLVPTLIRRGLTAWQFIAHGGVFADWTTSARAIAKTVAKEFSPSLVWATFGNTSNLALAQFLSHQAHCRWVMDIKDNWESFVPPSLRALIAWRFRDACGWTSNSHHHREVASAWLHQEGHAVIYSGVAPEFFGRSSTAPKDRGQELLLVGGTYNRTNLVAFLGGVRGWLNKLTDAERQTVRFVYAGSDVKRVSDVLDEISLNCQVEISQYLPIGHFAARTKVAFANAYLYSAVTFHHKLMELLVCGQPVISFPGEREESRSLAAISNTPFYPCLNEIEIRNALQSAWMRRTEVFRTDGSPPWRWSDFTVDLECFLQKCLDKEGG